MGCGGIVKLGLNIEFFFGKYNITTKHRSDHQFESVVVRIVKIERFHSVWVVDHGFGQWNARVAVGHCWIVIVQGAP